MRIGQVILLGIAVLLFFLGGRHYDARQMLGIKQIREGTSSKVITDTGELDTSGVLGITRHPWYLATVLFIWARQLDVSAILVNVIYLIGEWAGVPGKELAVRWRQTAIEDGLIADSSTFDSGEQ